VQAAGGERGGELRPIGVLAALDLLELRDKLPVAVLCRVNMALSTAIKGRTKPDRTR
jgi:hypothetical protein